jgi:hypothetical protein
MSRNTAQYGKLYWCVGVPEVISPDGEIYLHACRVEISDGTLIFWSDHNLKDGKYEEREKPFQVLALAPGRWNFVFAASVIDGAAISVEHWKGQIAE